MELRKGNRRVGNSLECEIWALVEQSSVRRALENKKMSTVKDWENGNVNFGEDWIQKAER